MIGERIMEYLERKTTEEQLKKYDDLLLMLKGFGSVAVAFSGGVDSTFLIAVAHEVLGE